MDLLEWRLNCGKLGPWKMYRCMLAVAVEPRAENRRLLWSTSLPQGALGMPVLELPRAVGNKAFFSSLNQISRMGCLLAFVFGADQQTYSSQDNGIVGLQ